MAFAVTLACWVFILSVPPVAVTAIRYLDTKRTLVETQRQIAVVEARRNHPSQHGGRGE